MDAPREAQKFDVEKKHWEPIILNTRLHLHFWNRFSMLTELKMYGTVKFAAEEAGRRRDDAIASRKEENRRKFEKMKTQKKKKVNEERTAEGFWISFPIPFFYSTNCFN